MRSSWDDNLLQRQLMGYFREGPDQTCMASMQIGAQGQVIILIWFFAELKLHSQGVLGNLKRPQDLQVFWYDKTKIKKRSVLTSKSSNIFIEIVLRM